MSASEVSINKYFLILSRHFLLIGGILVAALAIAWVVTYLTPKIYEASTSIHFDLKSANPMDNRGGTLKTEAYFSTQMDIIKSQNVSRKVEDSLSKYEQERLILAFKAEKTAIDNVTPKLINYFKSIAAPQENTPNESAVDSGSTKTLDISSAYGWLTAAIGSNLTVMPRFKSRIVDITYSSTDPEIATIMANRFTDAYIATNLQMMIDPARKTSGWFSDQLKGLRRNLEEAQAKLTAYQQKEEIVSTDERMDTENTRLQKLSTQLVNAQSNTRNAVTEQKKLVEVRKSGASVMTLDTVFNSPVVQKVKQEIRTLEGELAEISSTLGKNHPRHVSVNTEHRAARERLNKEIRAISGNINSSAELAKDRERDLSAALERQKQLVLNLKQEHNRISVLNRDVESAQATYNAALKEQNTTNMQSLVDQTNVSIIDLANIPGQPSSPILSKNLAIGGFAGLLLGIGLAILMEMLNRRVHSKEDLILELKVPLLGHLK